MKVIIMIKYMKLYQHQKTKKIKNKQNPNRELKRYIRKS